MPGCNTTLLRTCVVIGVLFVSCISAHAKETGKNGLLPVMDKDFACTSPEAAQRYQRDYSINVRSFGGDERCNSDIDTKKLYNDLQIVEEGRFGGSDTNVFIQNFVDRDRYYNWLSSMTYGVRRGHDVPWATAYNSGGYFTMQDGWTKLSTLGRVGTIIHEARHTEGYGHRACNYGPYSDTNLPGCDRSVQEGGSHGVEMEYYSRVVLQGVNFHPAYKAMARLMALGRANFVFNQKAMGTQDRLLALAGQQAHLISETDSLQAEIPSPVGFVLKRTSFGASLFSGQEAIALDLYAHEDEEMPLSDDFSYFKIIHMEQHIPAIDMEEFDIRDKRYLVSLDDQGNVRSFVFRNAQWSRPLSIQGAVRLTTVAPNGVQGLFVVKQDGRLCRLDPDRMSCPDVAKGLWPQDVKAMTYLGQELYHLKTDGQVIHSVTGQGFAPLQGQIVEQMTSVPTYDSFQL